MLRYTVGLGAVTGVGVATFHIASAAADVVVQGAVLKLDESRAHFGISPDVESLEVPETWAASMDMSDSMTPYGAFFLKTDEKRYEQQLIQEAETATQPTSLHIFDLDYGTEMQFEAPAALGDCFTRELEASSGAWQIPSTSSKQSVSLPTQNSGQRKHKRSGSFDSSSTAVLTDYTKRVHMSDSISGTIDEKGLISTVGLFLGTLESFKSASSKHEQHALYTTLLDLCAPDVGFSYRSCFGQSNRRNSGTGVEYILESISSTGNIPPLHCLDEAAVEDRKVYVHFLQDKQPGGMKDSEGCLLIFLLDDKNCISNVMSCSA